MNLAARIRGGGRPVVLAAVGLVLALIATLAAGLHSLTSSNAVALEEWIPSSAVETDAPRRSTVLAADGSVLATFSVEDRIELELDDMAPVLRNAVLAIEDDRFYEHGAIDPVGMARALAANIAAGSVREGGSTLTQQYVKQAFVSVAANSDEVDEATEATVSRKIREIGAALAVEEEFSKDEILRRYLNLIYFGNGAYGVEVAAQRYFSTSAADLTLPQAALLAGLIQAPAAYNPLQNPAAALQRRNVVLNRMRDTGRISAAAADAARRAPLGLQPRERRLGCADADHPFFCGYVVAEIRRLGILGPTPQARMQALLTKGLTIRTTLEPKIQEAAQTAVDDHIRRGHRIGAAIVMTEPGTGAVRAIALNRAFGEKNRRQTKVNYALDKDQGGSAGFQAGSTFKPFVAAAALDRGIETSQSYVASSEVEVDDFRNCSTGRMFPPYEVGNYNDSSYGRIDMAEATAKSVNTYYVQLAEEVGTCAGPKIAESMGLERADGADLSRVPSFVLGVDEVSPLRMAEAYATFAANGVHCESYAVTGIATAGGEELEVPGKQCERAISKRVAREVTQLLRGVIDGDDPGRTGARMSLGKLRAAGKTGTTNDATAVWFAGFTAKLAAAVWAGYPDAPRPLKNVRVGGTRYETLFGGALPGPIWRDAMKAALKDERERRDRRGDS